MYPQGGMDLSECDRVNLPVGYEGVSRKEKMERGKKFENYFCGMRRSFLNKHLEKETLIKRRVDSQ